MLYKKFKPIKSCLFPLSYPWLSCRITENSHGIIFMGLLFCIVLQEIPEIMEMLYVILKKIHYLKTLKSWCGIQINFEYSMFSWYTMRLTFISIIQNRYTYTFTAPQTQWVKVNYRLIKLEYSSNTVLISGHVIGYSD